MAQNKAKILDYNTQAGGRAGWSNIDYFKYYYLKNFKPLRSPSIDVQKIVKGGDFNRLQELILNTYKINSLEFGNWVNQTRRMDFELSLIVALYDFNKVLKFTNTNIGVNKSLNIAFGARGVANAFAHYEPYTKIINLSRDRRADKQTDFFGNKIAVYADSPAKYKLLAEQLREEHSGYGSFAHEYGHFLDYILAEKYVKNRHVALTGGREVLFSPLDGNKAHEHFIKATKFDVNSEMIELNVYMILEKILFTKKYAGNNKINYTCTSYYKRLYDYAKKSSDYWIRFNEIWARFFEIMVAYKLKKAGITNKFLVKEGKGKYRDELGKSYKYVYLTFGEISKVEYYFNKFLETTNYLINKK